MSSVVSAKEIGKRYSRPDKMGKPEIFWSLKDVSFEVAQGEVLGIIGKNGAGKSTLLKILSRITAPTEGEIHLRGRVGSLLEVGTGFHPELSGRENVFMNGAILGMGKDEVRRKFDAIVDFSGVETFIDMPVKRYSSGMYMRLAFAVAAHFEPEILIIDEVLAVGDADFQKKCLGKMQDVAGQGRTVLFVSHNMNAMRQLCHRCIHLEEGKKIAEGPVDEVVAGYLRRHEARVAAIWENDGELLDGASVFPQRLALVDAEDQVISRPLGGDELAQVEIRFSLTKALPNLSLGYALYDQTGTLLYWTYPTDRSDFSMGEVGAGQHILKSVLPLSMLNDGAYHLQLIAGLQGEKPLLTRELSPAVVQFEVNGHRARSTHWAERRPTPISPTLDWQVYSV